MLSLLPTVNIDYLSNKNTLADTPKPRVLFYRTYFFKKSETFIYHQVKNPYIHPFLLADRFLRSTEMPIDTFVKFKSSSLIAYWLTKWFGKQLHYSERSIAKIKRLLQGQSFDLIHAQFGDNGLRILPLARQLNLPMVVTFHGFDASRKLANRIYYEGLKELFDYASAIIVVNTGMADVLPLNEANRRKVRWVPCGVDPEQFVFDQSVQTKSFNILHVGRLIEKKGVPDLIRAFAMATKEVDKMTLHIVGTGKEAGECRALAKEYHLESKIIFHGWKSPKEVKELMQQCEVFVLNSRVASNGETEGLPVGLLEAMAMSRAVISTRHAGIPLAVENEVSGILVDERDTHSLSRQMLRLYHDKKLRLDLGIAARAKVENQFSMKRIHENLRDIYAEIAKK
jgi:glycosyltransferase involved in cell wall biosynthesis